MSHPALPPDPLKNARESIPTTPVDFHGKLLNPLALVTGADTRIPAPVRPVDDPLAEIIADALDKVHPGWPGLYTQALVMINRDVSFDQVNGYRTNVMEAGSGGGKRYSLTSKDMGDHPRPAHMTQDEARLSQKDSEVASLQDAYDWTVDLAERAQTGTIGVWGVHVLVVGNIGPCDGCKARLLCFFKDIVELFDSYPVSVIVDSIYRTTESSRVEERRGVATRYGYADAKHCGTYWRFRYET
jgi:hypothetical protein